MTAPTAGSGPTHPPGHPGTGGPPPPPPPSKGHLPGGTPTQFRVGDHVLVDGDRPEDGGWRITEIVTDNPRHDGPFARLVDPEGARSWSALRILRPYAVPQRLEDMVQDLRRAALGMIVIAGRQYDPASAPASEFDSLGPTYADRILGCVVSDLRTVLRDLDNLAASASTYPGPSDSSACLSGGSASHLASAPWASGVRPESTPPLGLGAGESSDPRPRIGGDAPEMTGVPTSPDEHHSVRPGVGFNLPQAKAVQSW